jgi:hypothetical protein
MRRGIDHCDGHRLCWCRSGDGEPQKHVSRAPIIPLTAKGSRHQRQCARYRRAELARKRPDVPIFWVRTTAMAWSMIGNIDQGEVIEWGVADHHMVPHRCRSARTVQPPTNMISSQHCRDSTPKKAKTNPHDRLHPGASISRTPWCGMIAVRRARRRLA